MPKPEIARIGMQPRGQPPRIGDLMTFDIDVMPRVLVQELGGATSGVVAEVVRGERVAVRIAGRADMFWCNADVLLRDEQQSLFNSPA